MSFNFDIATFLLHCEELGFAHRYGEPELRISSEGQDLFIISDLHLAAGRQGDGKYAATEKFFSDASFQRFLRYAEKIGTDKRAVLIINGDFIDFLRITDYPEQAAEFEEWETLLRRLGIPKAVGELRSSISKKEKKYGLKTDDYKSIWKLSVAVRGHPAFFDALALWLHAGHRLVIVKGNHDLEWFWPGVRNCLRLILAERLARPRVKDISQVLRGIVFPNTIFADSSVLIDDELYIEHGHTYDKYSHVVGPVLRKNQRELNIPFGSFFNRYLLNCIELYYPFIDNVRPRENLLPLLIREHFFLALRIFFQHIPFLLKLIPKRYFRYMFARFLLYTLPIIVLIGWATISILSEPQLGASATKLIKLFSSRFVGWALNPLKSFLWPALSYFFSRIVAYFQLKEPDSLAGIAQKLFSSQGSYRFIAFGHTHNPDQFKRNGRCFYNTGTWIPIVEISSGAIRHDKTYTFLHLSHDLSGKIAPSDLYQWNDDAERADKAVLVTRMGEEC
jgi:UDP-2,3-diacylglucosamine pyrophosphatase LpxH